MGFLKSISKSISSAIPKVTINNIAKPLTNAVQGVTNVQSEITGSVIGGLGTIANQGLNTAGSVLANPNAAPILGAAGAAYGIPGLGQIAGQFANKPEPTYSESPMQIVGPPGQPQNSNQLLIFGGIGAVVLIAGFLILKRKK